MLCKNCGATNSDGAQFCTSCGKPLHAVWQSPKSELVSAAALDGEEIVYAGFWARFAALFLDGLVLWVIGMVTFVVLGAVMGFGIGSKQSPGFSLALNLVSILISAAYFVSMESGERGATFGKRALKLRVVDVDGNRISTGRAVGRWFGHALSDITFFIGYLIQPFTARKQALHDMMSGTLVIRTDKSNSALAIVIAIVFAFFLILAVIGILAALAIPKYQSYVEKAKVVQAEAVGRLATQAVQNYAAKTGKVPASISETGAQLTKSPIVSVIKVNPDSGEVQVVFNSSAGSKIAGKALLFDPSRDARGQIVWKCTGPGIPAKMLPPDCK